MSVERANPRARHNPLTENRFFRLGLLQFSAKCSDHLHHHSTLRSGGIDRFPSDF